MKIDRKKNVAPRRRSYRKMLSQIRNHDFSSYRASDFSTHYLHLQERFLDGAPLSALIPETFALVCEAVRQTLSISPYDAQIQAAIAMNKGQIVELATGEGKTLVAVFVATLHALSGNGVHIFTFSDYLAERDARWMGPVYERLGLSVASVRESSSPLERKAAYLCDITYVTAREAGFDYLRSFLAMDEDEIVHRPFHYAIIDEADSIMLDEARIPMVIAGEQGLSFNWHPGLFEVICTLEPGIHFETGEYMENIYLTEKGIQEVETRLGIERLYPEQNSPPESVQSIASDALSPPRKDTFTTDLLTQVNILLPAIFLLKKDVDYIVQDGSVRLVDEFTGRISLFRRWPDGLQAAVELKEGLSRQHSGMVLNSVSFRHFIRMYPQFCGMTGTAQSSAAEFAQFYGQTVAVIPPNVPCIRKDQPDYIFTHLEAKYRAIVLEIQRVSKSRRPILLGTASVEESEQISQMLLSEHIDHVVLNARNDAQEAQIIADAGKLGAVTISTNMAGRGVDIRLGGCNEAERDAVCALGGLYVIGTNRYESVRIDDQLRGRAGRQGDPGESRFFISLQDPMLTKYGIGSALSRKFLLARSENHLNSRAVRTAILHTQRVVEGQNFDAKTTLEKYSFMPNEQRKLVEKKRLKILHDRDSFRVLEKRNPSLLQKLRLEISEEEYIRVRKQIELHAINRCWADHWLAVQSALDGIRIVSMLRGDPFLTFNQRMIESFESFEEHVYQTIEQLFSGIQIRDGVARLPDRFKYCSGATFSYLVRDGSEENMFADDFSLAFLNTPFYFLLLLFRRFFDRATPSDN